MQFFRKGKKMQKYKNQTGIPTKKQEKSFPWLAIGAIIALLVAMQSATQALAYFISIDGIFTPFHILIWAYQYYSINPDMFMKAGSIGIGVGSIELLFLFITKIMIENSARANESLHGSARWANKKDIETMALLPHKSGSKNGYQNEEGVFVGGFRDKNGKMYYLRHSGPEHVLTFAPTRSGKGVGLVIPTLVTWKHSTLIADLKGELWALTSGCRQGMFNNKVLRFEPASNEGCVCWNPLSEIRIGTENEVGDVQNLATLIVDPDGKGLTDHWAKTSFALLTGVILHVLYRALNENKPEYATLPMIDFMLADPNRDIKDLWKEMCAYKHIQKIARPLTADEKARGIKWENLPDQDDSKTGLKSKWIKLPKEQWQNHAAVGTAGRDMLDKPDDEGGSVLSTAKSFLSLYRDPIVAKNVSCSQFKIKDLMNQDNPASLYIVTQPNDKARLRPLVRIVINMAIRLLADKMEFKGGTSIAGYKHRLLMMLDEFPSLGKLEILQESLAFVAGYGIKCYLITQDLNQLKSKETGYGQDETITSNCHVQNAYPPNRIETAEHLSKLTGQTTVVKEQITTSGKRASALMGQVSKTYQETQRPLLTADECLRMRGPQKNTKGEIVKAGDMLIYMAGYPAIYGEQVLYFKDPELLRRAQFPAPKKSDFFRNATPPEKIIQSLPLGITPDELAAVKTKDK